MKQHLVGAGTLARVASGLILVALVAVACAGGSATPSATAAASAPSTGAAVSPSKTPQPVTFKLTTWTANEPGLKDWWPQLTTAFEAAHPGVKVEIQNTAFAGYIQSLTTRFAAGDLPDVINVPLPTTTLPAWAEAGFLAQLDDKIKGTDVANKWSSNQSAMQWAGKTYGVLLVGYGFVLFYNKAMLDAAAMKVPTTPSELLAAAKATTGGDHFGYAITADNSPNFVRDLMHFVTGYGGSWVTNGRWNWTDGKVVDAVDAWRTLARKYAPQGTDIGQKRQLFYDGKVAMMIEGPFVLAAVRSTAAATVKPSLHVAQVPFPVIPGDASHGLSIPSGLSAERQALAWDFIQLAASPKWQGEYAKLVTSPVARPGAGDVLLSDPDTAEGVRANDKAVPLIPSEYGNLRRSYSDFATIASDSFHSLLTGDEPTAKVLATFQQRLEAKGIRP